MNRTKKQLLLTILVVLGAMMLLPMGSATAQITCTLSHSIYWSPTQGNDGRDGLSPASAVRTLKQAEYLASQGGACIYQVRGTESPLAVKQVEAQNPATGVPLAQAALYGLLMLLAVALVAVGLWARRKAQVQPGYQSQA